VHTICVGSGTPALSTLFQTEQSPRSSKPLLFVGYAVSLVCLIYVLRDFHIVRAMRDIANADWRWVLLGVLCDVLSYVAQAWRWKLLLSPFGRVHIAKSVRSVFAGLFANAIFPLRPGEFLRSYVLANSENISLGLVLGSVGVERLIDLVIATSSLGVVSLLVDLPTRFRRAADILGIATLGLVTILVALIFYLELKMGAGQPISEAPRTGVKARISGALTALHAMGTAPSFYAAVLSSTLVPFFQILAIWCMMKSYSLNLPFLAAIVVVFVINLGISVPNAPANIGSYQAFCVLGLSVFDIEKTTATGFSFFAFFALTVPLVFLGLGALVRSGFSLRTLRERMGGTPRSTPA
jgi:glycosyltransferase 2 family protein